MRSALCVVALAALILGVAACAQQKPVPIPRSSAPSTDASLALSGTTTPTSTTIPKPTTTPTPNPLTSAPRSPSPTPSGPDDDPATAVFKQMTFAQMVGQLFMAGTPATNLDQRLITDLTERYVGSVILTGRSTAGISASRSLTDQLRTAAAGSPSGNVGLFVACDQEGGMVQVLRGPGFSDMPSAVEQAQWPTEQLRASARIWGQQLTAAGVNVDLGPVLDTVPPDFVGRNPPIDALDRQYGSTPLAVAQQGTAVAQGLTDAHVIPTVKHFPGLGRVTRNTDFSAGVIDTSTVRHDPFFAPFGAALKATDPFVMVSSAIYRNIDARQPAAFSPTVIGQLLRGDLGFGGVVISDDLGKSVQVKALTPGQRAVRFFGAGGDLLLDVFPFQIPQMIDAVTLRAQQDRAFYNTVNAAALTVLRAKQAAGLIHR